MSSACWRVTSFSVQGGMLMPIKEGTKLRSPRAHAASATQEISDYWEVDWPQLKLLLVPLADGQAIPRDFCMFPVLLRFVALGVMNSRLQASWHASGASLVSVDLHQSRQRFPGVFSFRFAARRRTSATRRRGCIIFRASNPKVCCGCDARTRARCNYR